MPQLPPRSPESELPKSTAVSTVRVGDLLLTNAIWENGTGSYEPETGVRFMDEIGPDGRPVFVLIQHRWRDFAKANDVIARAVRKGWGSRRISDFMENLKHRAKL